MARKPQKRRGAFGRVVKALLLDIVLIGLGLCIFALFHHVLPSVGVVVVDERNESQIDPGFAQALGGLTFSTEPTEAPVPENTPEPEEEPTPEPVPTPEPEEEPTPEPVPTPEPEEEPTPEPVPTPKPAEEPTPEPVVTPEPTEMPCETPAPEQNEEAPSFSGQEVGGMNMADLAPEAGAEEPASETGDFSALFDRAVTPVDEILVEKNEYLSEDVSIRITTTDAAGIRFHVADIYIRNIENFRTAFANDIYGRGQREYAWDISMDKGAILSVNGDYYGARDDGVVIRNGELYRDTLYQDVCVLYRDGVMETYTAEEFDCAAAMERGAWQAWSFGPMLLDGEGKAMSLFNSVVVNHNPRCGIGYYEPGHYCFVIVEGRNDHSRGATLAEFSYIFEQLGCTAAYNMDGGNTAVMTYGSRLVSEPSQGGRPVTDIIMITEVDGE